MRSASRSKSSDGALHEKKHLTSEAESNPLRVGTVPIKSNESLQSNVSYEFRPPDGGWGWVIVAAGFMVLLVCDGLSFSFAVPLPIFVKYFKAEREYVSWIGSLLNGCIGIMGPIASALVEMYGCRFVCMLGSALGGFGLLLSYFGNSVDALIITYGIIAGCGAGLMFVSSIIAANLYFDKKRSLATGIVTSGSGIGVILLGYLTTFMVNHFGWKIANVTFSALFFQCMVLGALLRPFDVFRVKVLSMSEGGSSMKWQSFTSIKSKTQSEVLVKRGMDREQLHEVQVTDASEKEESRERDMIIHFLQSEDSRRSHKSYHDTPHEYRRRMSLEDSIKHDHSKVYTIKIVKKEDHALSSSVSPPTTNPTDLTTQSGYILVPSQQKINDEPSSQSENVLGPTEIPGISSAASVNRDATRSTGTVNDMPELSFISRTVEYEHPGPGSPQNKSIVSNLTAQNLSDRDVSDSKMRRKSVHIGEVHELMHGEEELLAYMPDDDLLIMASICPKNPFWDKGIFYSGSHHSLWKREDRHRKKELEPIPDTPIIIDVEETEQLNFKGILKNMLKVDIMKNKVFCMIICINFVFHLGYWVPLTYFVDVAILHGIEEDTANMLVAVYGFTNTIGRIVTGAICDFPQLNTLFIYNLNLVMIGVCTLVYPFYFDDVVGSIVVTVMFGFFSAACVTLRPVFLVDMMGLDMFTNAFGLDCFFYGIATIIAAPFGGYLFRVTGTYRTTYFIAVGFIMVPTVFSFSLPFIKH